MPEIRYVSAAVGVIDAAVTLAKLIPMFPALDTRTPTIPKPACAVGLLTLITSVVATPAKANICSAVVFAATAAGVSAEDRRYSANTAVEPAPAKRTEVAVAAPSDGVTRFGDVAKTKAPVPVSLVTAAIRLALEGVARKVATPVARPDTPVLIGSPDVFVRTPDVGVPKAA